MVKPRARVSDNDPLSPTDRVIAGFEQYNKPASEQANNSESSQPDKSGGQLVSKLASEKGKPLALRKATFQLNEEVLKQLDVLHLQLQLELGKAEAPYKEVIVEEAIVELLKQDRAKMIEALMERQKER
jgi:hypothetical protein